MDNGKIPLMSGQSLDWYNENRGVSGDRLYAEILFARDVDVMRTLYMLEYGESGNNEDLHHVLFDDEWLASLHDDLMNRLGDYNRDSRNLFDARRYRNAMTMSIVNTLGDISGGAALVDGLDSLRYSLGVQPQDIDPFKGFVTPWMEEAQLNAVIGSDSPSWVVGALDDARTLMEFNETTSPLVRADVQYGQFSFPANPLKPASMSGIPQPDAEYLAVSRRGRIPDMADLIVKAGYMDDEERASDFLTHMDKIERGFHQSYDAFPQPDYNTLSTIADSIGVPPDINAVGDHLTYDGLRKAAYAYNDIMFARDMECLNAALMYEGWQGGATQPGANTGNMLTDEEIQHIRKRVNPHECIASGLDFHERDNSYDKPCEIEPHVIVDRIGYEQGLTQGIERVLANRGMDKNLATVVIEETRAMRFPPNMVDHRHNMEYFMAPSRNDEYQMVNPQTAAKIVDHKPYVQLTGVSTDAQHPYLTTGPSRIAADRKTMHIQMGNRLADFLTPDDAYQYEASGDILQTPFVQQQCDRATIYRECQDAWEQTEAAFDKQRQTDQQKAQTQNVLQSKIDAAKNLAARMCSDTQSDKDLSLG